MDKIKAKLDSMRQEVDAALARAEAAEHCVKDLELQLSKHEQETKSQTNRMQMLEAENDKLADRGLEQRLRELEMTLSKQEHELRSANNKIAMLEGENDKLAEDLKATKAELAATLREIENV